MNRLSTLDYLRGLAASGIMVYHFVSWNYGVPPVSSFLGKVGLYGVSVFYVLSGLTLYHVYFNKMNLRQFAIKRFFRIFPLMWLVMIGTVILLTEKMPDWDTLLLNFTGLFGIFRPWDYLGTGMWSIGNELVFYLFFPLLVFSAKRNIFWPVASTFFLVYTYFAFCKIGNDLSADWRNYINPLNQAFLFVAGFATGLKVKRLSNIVCVSFILAGLAIFFIPVSGDAAVIVRGWMRLLFTLGCVLIVVGVYKLPVKFPQVIHFPLSKLGEASYSIYLLHPLVGFFVRRLGLSKPLFILVAILITIPLSYLVYVTIEKYFINKANYITRRRTGEVVLSNKRAF